MKLLWRRNERTRSWFTASPHTTANSPTSPFAKGSMSVVYDAATRATLATRKATRLRPSSASPKKGFSMRRKTAHNLEKDEEQSPRSSHHQRHHRATTLAPPTSPHGGAPSLDFDIDSVSVADGADDEPDDLSESSSHAEHCASPLASPLEHSMDGECNFDLSSEDSGLDDEV
ncbi:hypothetical protein H310_14728 [Aphanomyces invadans]|uniref:Uncharacterized protein n=1 Tax=Aphanomyces invadans TaxID=157072 RepID=A0A024T8M9_9STRA|nr:hypothetical protein H310_14728 [Aphanomyces invadans]ETV90485.1 hypothetical protein H310_14728 [Aphanomyces invadans]|eukprot:XP_008880873.1 hypothetical protein H310_14728 [Aphanomyces invadans]